MKRQYRLTDIEFEELQGLYRGKQIGGDIDPKLAATRWRAIAADRGFDLASLQAAPDGDPLNFMAEPVEVPVTDDVRRGATSASNAQADLLCPGRHLAQKGLPEPDRGEDAAMGTRIHAALADSGNVPLMQSLSVGERDMFDSCKEIEKKVAASFFGETPQQFRVFRHERLWLPNSGKLGFVAHSGEPDAVWRAGTKALVVDYKVLTGDVADASSNQQLRDLAVLVMGQYAPLDEVATVIIQPLVTHSPEVCVYKTDDLIRAFQEMVARVKASNDPKSPRVAGEVQCKFCKAKSVCAEFARWTGTQLPVVVEPVQQALLFQVAMANWTPEQRALACTILPIATKRLEEIKWFLKPLAAAGEIPGWTVGEGATRETIINPQAVFDRFAALGGKLDQFFPAVKIQKGELAEAVAEVTSLKGKGLKAEMTKLLDGLTESKQAAGALEKVEAAK